MSFLGTVTKTTKRVAHNVGSAGYAERRERYLAGRKKKAAKKKNELSIIRAEQRNKIKRKPLIKKRKQNKVLSRKSRIHLI